MGGGVEELEAVAYLQVGSKVIDHERAAVGDGGGIDDVARRGGAVVDLDHVGATGQESQHVRDGERPDGGTRRERRTRGYGERTLHRAGAGQGLAGAQG